MATAPRGEITHDLGVLTDDAFLGGRLQILQPIKGYRAAIDAVSLAAAIPARAGDHILDVGFGVGVAGLCIANRVPGVHLTGVEVQSDLVPVARENADRNNIANVTVIEADILEGSSDLASDSFDHVFTNPPFYDFHKAISPPDESKSLSHMHSGPDFLQHWIHNSVAFLKPRGTFTLVHPAEHLQEILSVLDKDVGSPTVFPLWPGNGKPAKRVIVSGRKGEAGALRILPGLRLHAPPKRYAPEAEEVLRNGAAIALWD